MDWKLLFLVMCIFNYYSLLWLSVNGVELPKSKFILFFLLIPPLTFVIIFGAFILSSLKSIFHFIFNKG